MFQRKLIATLVCAALAGCGTVDDNRAQQHSSSVTAQASPEQMMKAPSRDQINDIIDRHARNYMMLQPGLASALNADASVAGDYSKRLPDYSVVGMKQVKHAMANAAAELSLIDLTQLDEQDRLHVAINQVIDQYYAGDLDFPAGYIDTWGGHLPFVVNQISGPLIDTPALLQDKHRVNNVQDADDYLIRLDAFAVMIDQVLAKVKADEKAGIVLPKNLFPNTLGFLDGFSKVPAAQHALVTSFNTKMTKVDSMDGKMRQQYLQKATVLVKDKILPGYKKVLAHMTDLQHRAPQADGIWAQPGGEGFYVHSILNLGDSTLSPQKIHQIGLEEVARITAQMDAILTANGKTQGTVGERMVALNDDPQFLYEDSDAGREQLLNDIRRDIGAVMDKAPMLFATLPKQEVVVKRVPVLREKGAPGGSYAAPALDGSSPGEYYINLYDMKSNPSFGLKTLTYHEAVPGHHFQIALNMEQQGLGLMRQNAQFNAYIEGWALYSELLAYEMGMYKDDPWGDLGRLQAELYRAARLVVDTGLHYKKWDRSKTIEYFYQVTGTSRFDAEKAIDRYMAWPGQALGYKLGMIKLIELRQWAIAQLGEAFDIKAFHDLVLLPGARPLPILEADVKRWVKANLN